MGYYINKTSKGIELPVFDKADYLILDGAKEIPEPDEFVENLVCVVENCIFDAALYCYCEEEMKRAKEPADLRPKRWLIHPNAAELAGHNKIL